MGHLRGGKSLFDTGSGVPAEPDIVLRERQDNDRFRLVLEVKYIDRQFSRDHVNQALGYAMSYRAPVVLVRPCIIGEVPGLAVHGTVAGVIVYRYLFDLAGELELEEDNFGRAIRALIRA